MVQSGTFQLLGQKLINIIIHKEDVVKIAPIQEGPGCIIYLKNKVPYAVSESEREVYKKLDWIAA
ncbi:MULTISPECIES: hypothetical protein [Dyadobacter]|jgi:hypothetical protein|uniref:Uncharacterized protein n=1 Tax=Dyadobacter chenhuakuii TaxID=2909339 RepID=A0A9X1U3M5_9BACT|nr:MULTISPECIES: hypothetical protein [Dyadobacter]MCE7071713.1 hypothetical protein [Dyadobacter sp. CY327]MCF2496461.1 hypothetical protein [Dyadobacter chenhuakuii]MCF2501641.1 hypothetical protein [Dyadobacter chenhuakuii]MCF2519372.1 hypothetical protein [Dyadobacter sp. CY351]USJ30518.1 hypothetical protein NFI80_22000 [Dyadobacter chenhuakuii]